MHQLVLELVYIFFTERGPLTSGGTSSSTMLFASWGSGSSGSVSGRYGEAKRSPSSTMKTQRAQRGRLIVFHWERRRQKAHWGELCVVWVINCVQPGRPSYVRGSGVPQELMLSRYTEDISCWTQINSFFQDTRKQLNTHHIFPFLSLAICLCIHCVCVCVCFDTWITQGKIYLKWTMIQLITYARRPTKI